MEAPQNGCVASHRDPPLFAPSLGLDEAKRSPAAPTSMLRRQSGHEVIGHRVGAPTDAPAGGGSPGPVSGNVPDAAWAETDELRVAEQSNPQSKSRVRPEEAAEKGVKAMLSRDDIGRHLTSEIFFSGDRLPGFSDTIEHPDGLVLVDTGMIDTTPAIEDDGEEWRPNPLPLELVSRVAVVVNTHLHFDHCGGNRLFPGIPIHVQRRELADARTEDDYTVREWVDFPGATYVEHDGEAEILPGVRLLPARGHTAGHQIVVVETDGGPVVLAGDVGDSFEELERGDTPGRQLVLELAAPTYLAHVAEVRVPHPRA